MLSEQWAQISDRFAAAVLGWSSSRREAVQALEREIHEERLAVDIVRRT